uniref:CCHC-type domain-containing protein n=1 Tax=Setaria italica TaxID=4555 RepID=K4A372_SETIT
SMRGGNSIHKGIKRKTTTQVIQVSPDGKHERENTLTTELPSSDYACQYAKDKLTGKITCMVCGEEGHYTCDCSMKNQEKKVDISCSSCDTNHVLGKCPMGGITCFICEGKNHVPAQCRLSPMLTAVTKYH